VRNAIRVAGSQNGNAHRARRLEDAAVTHRSTRWNVFQGKDGRSPRQRRLHIDHVLAGRCATRWRDVTVDGMSGTNDAAPGCLTPVSNGNGAGEMQILRANTRLVELCHLPFEFGYLVFGLAGFIVAR
jgi:hypothetical protein